MYDLAQSSPCRNKMHTEYLATLRTFPGNFSPQLAHPYRTKILRAMETILSSHIDELDKDTAVIAILLASNEMTRIKVRASGYVGWEDSREASSFSLASIPQYLEQGWSLTDRDPLILCTP